MRVLITILLITISGYVFSQPYTGAHSSNYDPLKAQLFNPGLTSTSLIKWSVNVIGFDFHVSQDYLKITGNLKDMGDFDRDVNIEENINGEDKSGNITTDIQMPSFMVNTPKAGAFSFYTRARVILEADDIDEQFLSSIYNDANNIYNWASNIQDDELSFNAHAFGEIALGYARNVYQNEKHAVSVGATFKLLVAGFSGKIEGNADIMIDDLSNTTNFGETNISAISSSALNYIDDENYELTDYIRGFGADLGAVYEFKTGFGQTKIVGKNKDKVKIQPDYFLKAGIGFIDIGKIKYEHSVYSRDFEGNNTDVDLNTITQSDSSFIDFDDVLNTVGDYTDYTGTFKTKLPTSMSLFADFKLTRGIYINTSALINLGTFKKDQPKAKAQNIYSITPRFELPAVGIYMPMAYNPLNGFEMGAGIRAGQFVLASSNIFSYLWSKEATSVDIQLAIAFGAVDKSEKRAAKQLLDEEDVIGDERLTPDSEVDPSLIDVPVEEEKKRKKKKKTSETPDQ
ncbi:MAG: hypothetical protein GY751_13315 [Bacteroidetes bacterium]|nr:hypothetical protein [Bacteroidota bacterium]